MPRNHMLKVRLSKEQLEKLQLDADIKGFTTLSQYMRHLAFEKEDRVMKKLYEMHEKLFSEV